jgi:hypothetical protein
MAAIATVARRDAVMMVEAKGHVDENGNLTV